MNSINEILAQLESPVDVERLIDKLAFALDNFEQANLEQPKLYLEAGRYLTWAVLEKARCEFKLETREAELGIALREGEKKTDKTVLAQVASNREITKLKKRSYLAKASEIWAKQLVEAYNQRLQVLSNITRIRTAETSSNLRAVKEKAAVDSVRRNAEKMRSRYDQE